MPLRETRYLEGPRVQLVSAAGDIDWSMRQQTYEAFLNLADASSVNIITAPGDVTPGLVGQISIRNINFGTSTLGWKHNGAVIPATRLRNADIPPIASGERIYRIIVDGRNQAWVIGVADLQDALWPHTAPGGGGTDTITSFATATDKANVTAVALGLEPNSTIHQLDTGMLWRVQADKTPLPDRLVQVSTLASIPSAQLPDDGTLVFEIDTNELHKYTLANGYELLNDFAQPSGGGGGGFTATTKANVIAAALTLDPGSSILQTNTGLTWTVQDDNTPLPAAQLNVSTIGSITHSELPDDGIEVLELDTNKLFKYTLANGMEQLNVDTGGGGGTGAGGHWQLTFTTAPVAGVQNFDVATVVYPNGDVKTDDLMFVEKSVSDATGLYCKGQIYRANTDINGQTNASHWTLWQDTGNPIVNVNATLNGMLGQIRFKDVNNLIATTPPAAGDLVPIYKSASNTYGFASASEEDDINNADNNVTAYVIGRMRSATTAEILPFLEPINPTGVPLGNQTGLSGLGDNAGDQGHFTLLNDGSINADGVGDGTGGQDSTSQSIIVATTSDGQLIFFPASNTGSAGGAAATPADTLQTATDAGNTTDNDMEFALATVGMIFLRPDGVRVRVTVDNANQFIFDTVP